MPGERLWFEYHCTESHESADAPIWLRSHQQVTVLAIKDDESLLASVPCWVDRFENACQFLYRVQFNDGLEWDVFEDELLDSPDEFDRPDPPPPVNPTTTGPDTVRLGRLRDHQEAAVMTDPLTPPKGRDPLTGALTDDTEGSETVAVHDETTIREGDRVLGESGVFFRDSSATGTVVGISQATENGEPIVLAAVRVDSETTPAWVPVGTLRRIGERE
jgi:hypothetical protein